MGPVEAVIVEKLEQAFSPSYLEVLNESASHSVPQGSESHFKVIIVADLFNGESLVKRHQAVYKALSEQLACGVHALALHTYTIDEWGQRNSAPLSPPCSRVKN
jgi:BolA protein